MTNIVAFKLGRDGITNISSAVAIEDLAISATNFAASLDLFKERLLAQSSDAERRNMMAAWDYMFKTLCNPLDASI